MKQLSKTQLKQRDSLWESVEEKHKGLTQAARDYVDCKDDPDAMYPTLLPVQEAYGAYKEALNDLKEFCDEIVEGAQSYYEERSEGWQEGEKGEAYAEWYGAWEDYAQEIEEAIVVLPDFGPDAEEEDLLDLNDVRNDIDVAELPSSVQDLPESPE
jgi:hypothetical protein